MPDEFLGQQEKTNAPVNQPVPNPTPAMAPVQVPPPVTASPMPPSLMQESFFEKYKWLLLAVFAVVVIGGAGILGYVLSRRPVQPATVVGETGQTTTGEEIPTPAVEEEVKIEENVPGQETGSQPAADQGGAAAPSGGAGNQVQPADVVQPPAGEAVIPPAAGTSSQPVINVPQQPAVQIPQAPVVNMPAAEPIINAPQNIISAGSVSVSLDANTPKTQVVSGKILLDVVDFNLAAQNKTFKITDITLALNDEFVPKSITAVVLKYDGQIIYKELLDSSNVSKNFINISKLNFEVSPMKVRKISVSYQLADVASEKMSGKNIQTSLYSMKGVDTDNRSLSYAKIVQGNPIYVYKSYPSVSSIALSNSTLIKGINTLAKFSIANKGDNKIAWKKIVLNLRCRFDQVVCGVSSGEPVDKYDGLYNLEVLGPGVALGEQRTDLLVKNLVVYRLETINGVTSQLAVPGEWRFTHYTGGQVVGSFLANAEQEVAGTKTYAVKGEVLPAVIAGDYVSTKLPNTSKVIVSSAGSGQVQLNVDASLAWTDYSALSHTLGSGDWHNDFLIKYLPLVTQTVKK